MPLNKPRSKAVAPSTGPVVVLLGTFTHEGLTAKIDALGFSYVNRNLRSTPRNWSSIASQVRHLVDEGRLPVAFMYLSSPALLHIADETYDQARGELVGELERTKSLIFVYEDALRGVVKPFPWEVEDADDPGVGQYDWRDSYRSRGVSRKEWLRQNEAHILRARTVLAEWSQRRIDLLPFRTRSDVTIRMFEALDDAEGGVFLRLYVPHGRYQSEQFEDFLTIFTRYLREVEGREFSVDVERTSAGTAYLFKGRGEASNLEDLRAATQRFDEFLVASKVDPSRAERQLIAQGTPKETAGFIVAKYARASNRLALESRHEFERRHLMLAQQLEAELLEVSEATVLPQITESEPSSLFAIVGNTAPVTVMMGQLVQSTGVLAAERIVSGAVNYNEHDRAILARIGELEDVLRVAELRSDLDRLKDASTTLEVRRSAVQRLKGFLYETSKFLGKKADEVATKVLIAYLESQIRNGAPGT